ncbi:MAG TPA: neuraminidase-like domain-containing protein [Saprospiraceae bacterium]|nr:neuraminidase-like domain-containing protein [Saprospiraceae bacterium]
MANITITGSIVHQNGNPVNGLRVAVSEQQLRGSKRITAQPTLGRGVFSISLNNVSEKLRYYVQAIDGDEKAVASLGPFHVRDGDRKLQFVLEDQRFRGTTIFRANEPELSAFLNEWRTGGTDKPITVADADFVSEQAELPLAEVWHWLQAHQLEADSKLENQNVPAEVLYGLLRQGLPANIAALSALPSRQVEQALKKAQAANQVADTTLVSEWMRQWNKVLAAKSLSEKPEGLDASLGELLTLAGATANDKQKLMELFSTHEGTDEAYWTELATKINNTAKIGRIRKVVQVAAFTGFQPRMVSALLNETIPANQHALAALARKDAADWEAFIQSASSQSSAVPAFIKGNSEAERRQIYAGQLAKSAELAFPTHAFFGRLAKLPATGGGFGAAKTDLQTFFTKNPGFDFKTALPAALSDGAGFDLTGIGNAATLLRELRSARRLMGFVQGTQAIQRLRQDGLDSAQAVSNMPRRQFAQQYAAVFGSEEAAAAAHRKATQKSAQVKAIWAAGHPNLNIETAATHSVYPNLRTLFGSLEACDCEHCMSVYSPAAYLTDLLHFLESRNEAAYNELVRRRPDLPQLLLNCENTQTPLPYVDLVIELLEDQVLAPQPPANRQTTLTAAELAANPEYSNAEAYVKLKNAVYPFKLPFDLALEESRVYLSHLNAPRQDVMRLLFPGTEGAAFDDSSVAFEFLGLSSTERDIISAQVTGDGSADNGTWNFYGFDKATGFRAIADPAGGAPMDQGTWLAVLSGRVDVFLQQTELKYVDLLALLSCDFINPQRKIRIVSTNANDPATCQLDQLRFDGLEESDLVRLHRFLRLSRRLQWHFYALDKALKFDNISGVNTDGSAKPPTGYLNADQVRRLSQIEQLRRHFDVGLEEILTFWHDIHAERYTDFSAEKPTPIPSLYERLFRNKAVLNPLNPAFTADPAALSGNMEAQASAVQASLEISEADYLLLVSNPAVVANDHLTISNLSALARVVSLARWTGLTIADLLAVIELTGSNPFTNPSETHAFLLRLEDVQSSGFSIAELDYLLRDRFEPTSSVAPNAATVNVFFETLAALPGRTENTVAEKCATQTGLSAKAASLLLKQYLKSNTNPATALIQDFIQAPAAEGDRMDAYRKLDKAAFLINKLKITDSELDFLLQHHAAMGSLDFNTLPLQPQPIAAWDNWETLLNLIRARDLLGYGTGNLFIVLEKALINPSRKQWIECLAQMTGWELAVIQALVGTDNAGILKTEFPTDFCNGNLILRLKKATDLVHTTGLSTATLTEVAASSLDMTAVTAQNIKQAAKAKYAENEWLSVSKPLRDVLREQQRQALLNYVVHRSTEWRNPEELYEHQLIDVEMKPISMTSRLKQAICSVQLFVDRVLMNLERQPDGTAILLDADQAKEWKTWRKIYRVWEANRKIFLYPENWIEPELRGDQTPFFRDAVSQLLQNELSAETAEDAFRGYLEKLDEVARLEMVGIVRQPTEENGEIVYVFGRTYAQPHKYFHRSFEKGEWSPWLKIEGDIDSGHLIPVVFNQRLCLFWLFFTQEAEEGKEIDPTKPVPKTKFYWKIQVAWSEYRNNTWSGKKLSKSSVYSARTDSKSRLSQYRRGIFMRHYKGDGRLFIHLTPANELTENTEKTFFKIGGDGEVCAASFVFENIQGEPTVQLDVLPPQFSLLPPKGGVFKNQLLRELSAHRPLELQIETVTPQGRILATTSEEILKNTPYPKFSLAVDTGVAQPLQNAFVFQDSKHCFWVEEVQRLKPRPPMADIPDLLTMEKSIGNSWHTWLSPASDSLVRLKYNDISTSPDATNQEDDPYSTLGSGVSNENEIKCLPKNPFAASTPDLMALRMAAVYAPSANAAGSIRFNYRFTTFYHPQVESFMRALNQNGVSGVLRRSVQEAADAIAFRQNYQPTAAVIGADPNGVVDFAYGGPYAQYNWELFFHLPIHIACRLSADQRFEEARRWFHYVFDPTTGEAGGKERFWQFKPFYNEATQELTTLTDLLKNEAELARQVEKWADNPFQPHVVARMRITAYMKFTLMKYMDNLIAWGDQLFRRDTIESINEATNLYILAAKILGAAPQKVPARTQRADKSFADLNDQLDAFSNATVDIELFLTPSDSAETGIEVIAGALGSMYYFGVPRNESLLRYWETVADRLFKIRHSLNIEGITRSLPLFEPPIDPALLVRATAADLDLNSLLDANATAIQSNYRFAYMLQKANELVNEVKGLGAALLSALERQDAEALSLMRSGHEQHLLATVLQVRERQVEEAKEQIKSLKKSKELIELRKQYFNNLKDFNFWEQLSIQSSNVANSLWPLVSGLKGVAALVSPYEAKIGPPTTVGVTLRPGRGFELKANIIQSSINLSNGISGTAGYLGQRQRKKEERLHQLSLATKELEQIDPQILAAEIRLAIAQRELSNHRLQMEQSAEADEFMRSKFTNRQLFHWMAGQVASIYFQTYQLAYDYARQAEQCFQLELPHEAPAGGYVNFGHWDNLKKGLMAGEKLQFDLRRLELAFMAQNKRELEITKHISLQQLHPFALLQLRETGKCDFAIPEELFDLDFPGHYMRRIKSVSITIPCIAGPYTTINATLRLTKNEFRRQPNLTDPLTQHHVPVSALAASSGQGDSGVFELSFRDERYLPFEGAGAISEWSLELMEDKTLRQFDYNTIADVILHIRYTARESETLKTEAIERLNVITTQMGQTPLRRLFSLRYDFPNEWHAWTSKGQDLAVRLEKRHFPYFAQMGNLMISKVEAFEKGKITYPIDLNQVGNVNSGWTITGNPDKAKDDWLLFVHYSI